MTEQCQKKNYYFLQTILQEIKKHDIVSFNIFDTLIVYNLLFPQDIFKLISEKVKKHFDINDFNFIRMNMEEEVRKNSLLADNSNEDVSFNQIYDEISHHYPNIPVNDIKNIELDIVSQNIAVNPFIKKIYDAAVKEKKQIFFIANSCLPNTFIEKILKDLGFNKWDKLYLSGDLKKTKCSGSMYKYIIENDAVSPEKWIHIGSDYHSDISVARLYGITAGFFRCPREWFFMERSKKHAKIVEETGENIPEPPLDDSIEFSHTTALDINKRFLDDVSPDSNIIISAQNVSMMFNMSKEKVDNLKEYVIRFLKKQLSFKEFWALKDINFEIRKGEKVGLVGLNGSGKSTMLKIVSGVLKPTNGKISVNGAIAPMIELGAGFDFELSARENVYLNGAILGYSHAQMDKYYDDIISFAELEDFQDVAIKNFSSGMISRLGFAIATCRIPDILIIDEILSVGDFAFQKKCHKRMKKLTEQGTTVLFVSHSAGDIIEICDKAVWLEHGNVIAEGEAQYIVEKYLNKNS